MQMEYFRWAALAVLILFSFYTVYATSSESFWNSLKTVITLRWGRLGEGRIEEYRR